ncbi:(ZYRO0A11770g) [Zygosaccharomyces parabailii]|nr:(ZYRO0A11770g) [Zygosaccharomyces parabailii]
MLAVTTSMSNQEAEVPSKGSVYLARSTLFHQGVLYNVLPSDLTNERAFAGQRCKLFRGDVVLEEYMNMSESSIMANVPKYVLKFQWCRGSRKTFCKTGVVDNVHKWNETIGEWADRYRVMMQCSENRYVLLELRFIDGVEDRRFRDVLCRISEEFEILAEMMGD